MPVHQRGMHTLLRLALLIIFLCVTVFFAFFERDINASDRLVRAIEQKTTGILQGGRFEFSQIRVSIRRDFHPIITFKGVQFYDAAENRLANVDIIRLEIDPGLLIWQQQMRVRRVHFEGLHINLERAKSGNISVNFTQAAQSNKNFMQIAENLKRFLNQERLASLEIIQLDGVIINYSDARADQNWTMDGGRFVLNVRGDAIRGNGSASILTGRSFVTSVEVDFEASRHSPALSMGLRITDGFAGDVASQFPALSWLSVVDAPVSISLRSSITEERNIGPLFVALQAKEGNIQPDPDMTPILLKNARAYMVFEPGQNRIQLDQLSLDTNLGSFDARGQGIPVGADSQGDNIFESQIAFENISFNMPGVFGSQINPGKLQTDMRVTLRPFKIEVGHFALSQNRQTISGSGIMAVSPQGPSIALNLKSAEFDSRKILAFWPQTVIPSVRNWLTKTIHAGTLHDITFALRAEPGEKPVVALNTAFDNAQVKVLKNLPDITDGAGFLSIHNNALSINIDAGKIVAPQGGAVDFADSSFVIANLADPRSVRQLDLQSQSTITAALSVLDQPPWEFLKKAGRPVDFADGRAEVRTTLNFIHEPGQSPKITEFQSIAQLFSVRSDQIVPNKVFRSAKLDLKAGLTGLTISGDTQVDGMPISANWQQYFGQQNGEVNTLNAKIPLTPDSLAAFNVVLPSNTVRGAGQGDLRITFPRNVAPKFLLTSDLRGVELRLDALSVRKPPAQRGALKIEGELGKPIKINNLSLNTSEVSLNGRISFTTAGALSKADFSQVQIGQWFSGSAALIGTGPGNLPNTDVTRGVLDMRNLPERPLGVNKPGSPINVALDRMIITPSLSLRDVRGQFANENGLSGAFTANLEGVNADILSPVSGRLEPHPFGSRITLNSDVGGEILGALGIIQNGGRGDTTVILEPVGNGVYDGAAKITNLRIQNAPVLAQMLDALSIVGVLNQLDGEGMLFPEVDASFRITPQDFILAQFSAINTGIGLTMDGSYNFETQNMDFQGVITPFYLLNGIGSVISKKGEGVIGFNYLLKGLKNNPTVEVNLLSLLTPGNIRNIFRQSNDRLAQ